MIKNSTLADIYKTTERQVARWKKVNAPLRDPAALLEFLLARDGRQAGLVDLLDDPHERARITQALEQAETAPGASESCTQPEDAFCRVVEVLEDAGVHTLLVFRQLPKADARRVQYLDLLGKVQQAIRKLSAAVFNPAKQSQ